MKQHFSITAAALVAGLTASVSAHTVLTTLFVDDVRQGEGTCIRMPLEPETCTSPIASINSDDMACGVDGEKAVAFTCPAPAGGKLTFQFREWADDEQPGALDKSHKGSCAIYAKQLHDMDNDAAAGSGWIKLWDEGYDTATRKWCTEKLIANGGLLSFAIPEGLPAGYWLFRPELLALHDADKGDPQFYVGCAQVFVRSSYTTPLDVPVGNAVSIPGHVHADDAGLTFNIYRPISSSEPSPYPLPGPDIFVVPPPPGGEGNIDTTGPSVPQQTQGIIPTGYLVKNANWVGFEVNDYADESGCWDAAEDCWRQAATCYADAPPTGDAGCISWERKCAGIRDACARGSFNGPPNKGKVLAVKEPSLPGSIPQPVNT